MSSGLSLAPGQPLGTAQRLALLPAVEALAWQAGALILQVYAGDFQARTKADASPVTLADEQAEALIVPGLRALLPGCPVVAEEAASRGETAFGAAGSAAPTRFWLVDPLDGTREFVSRNGEFTVNIALIEQGQPVLGVVLVPVADRLYAGVAGAAADASQAWVVEPAAGSAAAQRRRISCRRPPAEGWVVAGSRSHGDEAALQAWLGGRAVAGRISAGSSLKFGLLAEGLADVYPRLGRTMEWDTAAGHAVLCAAGGEVLDLAGQPLRYGKPGHANPHFVAQGWR